MKKIIILYLFSLILLSSFVSAQLLEVKSVSINDALAKEVNMSATFNVTVINTNDYKETFEIDTLLDMELSPTGFMEIPAKSTLVIPIEVRPSAYLKSKYSDVHSFSYYVRGLSSGTVNYVFNIKIVSLRDALDIKIPATVRLSDKNLVVIIENKENMWVNGNLKVSADMLSGSKEVTIAPLSKQDIEIPIETVRKTAGKYLITSDFETPDYTLEKKEEIVLEPSVEIKSDESRTGSIFVYTSSVEKTNTGNIKTDSTIMITKTAVASWFTTFSQTPNQIERKGMSFVYSWTKKLDLDESFEIKAKTDYSLPLTVLFIVAISLIMLAIYFQKQIIIRKRTARVKTSTGGFALKVQLNVKCIRGEAREVTVTDFIPIFAQLYDKSAPLPPDRKVGRALTWFLGNMIKGEEKTITYIIYSRINVVGKIELPVARGSYKSKRGGSKHVNSNNVFILAEESQREAAEI
jgi:hypothetical protein